MTLEQIVAQFGISGLFIGATIAISSRYEGLWQRLVKVLEARNAALEAQVKELQEQNRLMFIAVFNNNPDAMRAYAAMSKTTTGQVPPMYHAPTDLAEK